MNIEILTSEYIIHTFMVFHIVPYSSIYIYIYIYYFIVGMKMALKCVYGMRWIAMGYDVIEWSLTMKHGDELVFLGEWLSSVGPTI